MDTLTFFKSIRINRFTSTITVEHSNADESISIPRRLEAISVLLGGYNVYGRKIDQSKHRDRIKRFYSIIEEIEEDIKD